MSIGPSLGKGQLSLWIKVSEEPPEQKTRNVLDFPLVVGHLTMLHRVVVGLKALLYSSRSHNCIAITCGCDARIHNKT